MIHHGSQYKVMTNSPTFDQQLALNTYWQQIGLASLSALLIPTALTSQ
ncbi:choloylglycine hydrolase [Vibrio cholerae]|nr:choloylglycine hydrolase [Vibrio cholerae]